MSYLRCSNRVFSSSAVTNKSWFVSVALKWHIIFFFSKSLDISILVSLRLSLPSSVEICILKHLSKTKKTGVVRHYHAFLKMSLVWERRSWSHGQWSLSWSLRHEAVRDITRQPPTPSLPTFSSGFPDSFPVTSCIPGCTEVYLQRSVLPTNTLQFPRKASNPDLLTRCRACWPPSPFPQGKRYQRPTFKFSKNMACRSFTWRIWRVAKEPW